MFELYAFHVTGADTPELTFPDNINIVEELSYQSFMTRLMSDELSFDLSDPPVDVVFASLAVNNDTRGLGVEGALTNTSIPVVSITTTPDESAYPLTYSSQAEYFTSTRFDEHITPTQLHDPATVRDLRALVRDYELISDRAPLSRTDIIALLDPPDYDAVENHLDSLPVGDIHESNTTSDVRYVAKWVRDRFLATPGAVMSTTRAALRLGVTVDSFTDHANTFTPARYTGLFSDVTEPRWWTGGVGSIHTRNEEDLSLAPARCVKCGRTGVDRGAEYNEQHLTTVQPVHYECSNIVQTRQQPYVRRRVVDPTDERVETIHDRIYGDT